MKKSQMKKIEEIGSKALLLLNGILLIIYVLALFDIIPFDTILNPFITLGTAIVIGLYLGKLLNK